MLQWTTAGEPDRTPGFGLIVHHTDAEREYAYDRASHVGKLDKALDEGGDQGLDRRRYEERLEANLPVRKMIRPR